MSTPCLRPKLRALDVKRLRHEGRWYFHLRDQLALSGEDLLVPMEFGPALALFDGEHDLTLIRGATLLKGGLEISATDLVVLVRRLDQAVLLDNERYQQAMAAALDEYHAGAFRVPAMAGKVYPENPSDLTAHLLAFEMAASASVLPAASVAGVLSPHIDYARGGAVYAQGWRQASAAARRADAAIILGTDHAGGPGSLTFSRQPYATPWGAMPPCAELQTALTRVLGEEGCFAEELHHRSEHSIELALVWLHHVRGGRPLRVLPVLCGYPAPFMQSGFPGAGQPEGQAIELMRQAVADGALVVVAGDLAHVGPAFGDREPFGEHERAAVKAADMALLAACADGATAALQEVAATDDRYRICGLAPLALALAIMPPVRFELAEYAQCPADAEDASFVSVAGGCFVRQTRSETEAVP